MQGSREPTAKCLVWFTAGSQCLGSSPCPAVVDSIPSEEEEVSSIIAVSMPRMPALTKFRRLLDDISRIYETARRVQVLFAWEIGRCIIEGEQDGDIRAEYGSRLLLELSRALGKKFGAGFSKSNLEYMRRFYLANKKTQPAGQLTWTNHVELMRIKDPKVRRALEARAIKEGLGKYEVRRIVATVNRGNNRKEGGLPRRYCRGLPPLKRPTDLTLNTYRKSKLAAKIKEGYVLLDCGFFISWPVLKQDLAGLTVTDTPSYTYVAAIDRVIDADTLVVLVEVGFGIIMHDKLRLRGIDAPEVGTPEGDKAKRYVMGLLPVGSTVVLKSHKTRTDPHGRFVADVFFKSGEDDPQQIIKAGTYLNQHLLDKGYAVRMKG